MKDSVQTHVVRFFHPDSIFLVQCMAFNHDSSQVAVLKRTHGEDQSDRHSLIEVWRMRGSWTPVVVKRMFVDREQNSLLENVVWGSGNRLFSCGQNSCLNEHDVASNRIKRSLTVGGGIIWSMACDETKQKMALGSEDGSICVFEIADSADDISFARNVGKCATRVLSIVWTARGSKRPRIIAGSIDHITIWDVKKCTCLDKLDVKQGNVAIGQTIVWSLAVYGNYLISGDSKGFTSFWDLEKRVAVSSVQSHESDVLTIAVDSTGRVFSSGVDPKIECFQIHGNGVDLVHEHKVVHHDIKSMIIDGKDGLLVANNGPFLVHFKRGSKKSSLSFLGMKSQIHLFDTSVLFNYYKTLELYDMSADEEPVKSLVVRSKSCILSSAFNSSYVVYRTFHSLSILMRSADRTTVHQLEHEFTDSPLSIDHLLLLDHRLVIVCDNVISFMSLADGRIVNQLTLPESVYYCLTSGRYIISVLTGGGISFLDSTTWTLGGMQQTEGLVVDHAVSPKDENEFWFLTTRRKVLFYNITNPLVSVSSDVGSHSRHIMFQGMTICKRSLLLHTNDFILSLAKHKLHVIRNSVSGAYKHIVALESNGRVLIVVELLHEELQRLLPSKFDGKTTQPFLK